MKRVIHSLIILLILTTSASAQWFGKDDPWVGFEPPPDDKFDWLQLTSGEWLKGNLEVIYDDVVEFDSDEFNLRAFDLEDVKRIRTSKDQKILIEKSRFRFRSLRNYQTGNILGQMDTEEVVGLIELRDNELTIISGDDKTVIRREQIVAVAQNASRERDRWSGDITVSVTMMSGNSDNMDMVTQASIKRRTAHSRYNADYTGSYSEALGDEVANSHRINAAYDHFVSSRMYLQVIGMEFYTDPFANIRIQYSVHTGLGFYLINTSRTKWSTGSAVGYQKTDYETVLPGEPDDAKSPFLAWGTTLEYEITGDIDFLYEYSMRWLNEESGRYTHNMLAKLSFELIDDLDFDITYMWDRIEKPTQAADGTIPEQNDYRALVGLSYEF